MRNIFNICILQLSTYPLKETVFFTIILILVRCLFDYVPLNFAVVFMFQYFVFWDFMNFLIENKNLVNIFPIQFQTYFIIICFGWLVILLTMVFQALIVNDIYFFLFAFSLSFIALIRNIIFLYVAIY